MIDNIMNKEDNSINEQLLNEQKTWTSNQWIEYLSKDGIMSEEEAMVYLKECINEILKENNVQEI